MVLLGGEEAANSYQLPCLRNETILLDFHKLLRELILTDPFSTCYLHRGFEIVYHQELTAIITFTEQTPGSPKVLQKRGLPLGYCGRFTAFTFTIKLTQPPYRVTSVRGNGEANIFVNVCFRGVEAVL